MRDHKFRVSQFIADTDALHVMSFDATGAEQLFMFLHMYVCMNTPKHQFVDPRVQLAIPYPQLAIPPNPQTCK
jgi:hypothetical protein